MKAQIDFTAKWELPSIESSQPEVTVQLAAKGTMDNLRLRFTSDPAMDETQILACLTTGRPPASAVGQASANTAATSAGTAIALGQAAGAVEDIGASVGLDVLQVRDDGVRGATVVAGSYVNPKTYVGVRQSATFENQGTSSSSTGASTEVELEYMLVKWLVANFQGGVSDVRLMFRSRYSY
jgi:translocation and assembly module TamB